MKNNKRSDYLLVLAALICAILGIVLLFWRQDISSAKQSKKTDVSSSPIEVNEAKLELAQCASQILLDDEHLSPEQVAAILALIDLNSGFDPEASNFEAQSYGLLQWSTFRKENLYSFANIKGEGIDNFQLQLEFLVEEIKPHSDFDFINCQLHSFDNNSKLEDWYEATTVAQATEALVLLYERPAPSGRNLEAKIKLAEKYYKALN